MFANKCLQANANGGSSGSAQRLRHQNNARVHPQKIVLQNTCEVKEKQSGKDNYFALLFKKDHYGRGRHCLNKNIFIHNSDDGDISFTKLSMPVCLNDILSSDLLGCEEQRSGSGRFAGGL